MTRTTHLILCALGALALATVASGAASETGITSTQVADRRHDAAERPGLGVPVGGEGRRGLLPLRQRQRRREQAEDQVHLQGRRATTRPRPLDKTRELVQQDKVFAIFNSLGTEQNLATRAYLNAIKVPQLFVASGATTFGKDYKQYPWTIGYQPNYRAEGTIYGRYVAKTSPKARIGVLYQNDDYGKDLLAGLRNGLGKKAKLIVSKQSYDVDRLRTCSRRSRKLKAAKVNTLMLFATPKFAIQSYVYAHKLGWKPKVYVNAVSSAANIMGLATRGHEQEADRGLDLDRLPQGPDRRRTGRRTRA